MKLKEGINPAGVRPELLLALLVADRIYTKRGQRLVVTSLNDGTHGLTSLHYAGCAADLRTKYFTPEEARDTVDELKTDLGNGPDYDVVLESDHIHVEWQPKRRG